MNINQFVWKHLMCWAGTCVLFWFEIPDSNKVNFNLSLWRIVFSTSFFVSNVLDNAEKAPRDACSMKGVMRNRGNPRNISMYTLWLFSAGSARWWSHHPGALALRILSDSKSRINVKAKLFWSHGSQSPNKIPKWTYWIGECHRPHCFSVTAKPDPTVHISVLQKEKLCPQQLYGSVLSSMSSSSIGDPSTSSSSASSSPQSLSSKAAKWLSTCFGSSSLTLFFFPFDLALHFALPFASAFLFSIDWPGRNDVMLLDLVV